MKDSKFTFMMLALLIVLVTTAYIIDDAKNFNYTNYIIHDAWYEYNESKRLEVYNTKCLLQYKSTLNYSDHVYIDYVDLHCNKLLKNI